MPEADLALLCSVAFATVFILLSLLAVAMRLLTAVFPERAPAVDPALVAVISTAVASVWSGARVIQIEEEETR